MPSTRCRECGIAYAEGQPVGADETVERVGADGVVLERLQEVVVGAPEDVGLCQHRRATAPLLGAGGGVRLGDRPRRRRLAAERDQRGDVVVGALVVKLARGRELEAHGVVGEDRGAIALEKTTVPGYRHLSSLGARSLSVTATVPASLPGSAFATRSLITRLPR